MTKLLDRVDSAATKGARDEAAKSHASMLRIRTGEPRTGKGELKIHGVQGKTVVVRVKPK
ncbi:hypothetical protein [Afipia broomeae]|uniref:Uncharacterized protein n=1 Tax=Afipia broomeae ATCC 49717 TaxID=883078 RepID=K8P3T5_9BRAD|nr:hypothetical protein [Afipia broomeae]EKS34325.1 hypothetical protein HMPREF9695_04235 [Afipia broomeae ATCC 49717]